MAGAAAGGKAVDTPAVVFPAGAGSHAAQTNIAVGAMIRAKMAVRPKPLKSCPHQTALDWEPSLNLDALCPLSIAGICSHKTDHSGAQCDCKQLDGYQGDHCQVSTCSSNPCQNEGTCSGGKRSTYTCACAAGFDGINCEHDLCRPSPCNGHGSCSRTSYGSLYSCKPCNNGWTGVNCAEDIDECLDHNAGCDGSCNNTLGSFFCGACPVSSRPSPECCTAGERGEGPSYGPKELCCSTTPPAHSTTGCALCTAHSWNSPGCTGAPNAAKTSVVLYHRLGSIQSKAPPSNTADTDLYLVIDPRDIRQRYSAELQGSPDPISDAKSFVVQDTSTAKMVAPIFDKMSRDTPKYTYSLRVNGYTRTGQYTLGVTLQGGTAIGGSPVSLTIRPGLPSSKFSTVIGVKSSDVSETKSQQCVADGRCVTLPGQVVQFEARLSDQYGNSRPRSSCEDDEVILQKSNLVSTPSFAADVHSISMKTSSHQIKSVQTFTVVIVATSVDPQTSMPVVLKTFTYTTMEADPATVEPFLAAVQPPGASLVAGELGSAFIQVCDDDQQCTASYNEDTGCTATFHLQSTLEIRVHGTEGDPVGTEVQTDRSFPRPGIKYVKNSKGVVVTHGCNETHLTSCAKGSPPPQDIACLEFVIQRTVAGRYELSLHTTAVESGSQSDIALQNLPWAVVVKPAALDLVASVRDSGPQFRETVAGRRNGFSVYPRDAFGNLRDQQSNLDGHHYLETNDVLTATARGLLSNYPGGPEPQYMGQAIGNRRGQNQISGNWNAKGHVLMAQFTDAISHQPMITVAGSYNISVLLNGLTLPKVFVIDVIPAELAVPNTLVYHGANWTGEAIMRPNTTETFAGTGNTLHFTPRDQFGNARVCNDTIEAEWRQGGGGGQQSSRRDEVRLIVSSTSQCKASVEPGSSYYSAAPTNQSVEFDTETSHVDPFSVTVKLGMQTMCGPHADRCGREPPAPLAVRDSPFHFFVRPADLDPLRCRRSETGPGYNSTEAGRNSFFPVLPRE